MELFTFRINYLYHPTLLLKARDLLPLKGRNPYVLLPLQGGVYRPGRWGFLSN